LNEILMQKNVIACNAVQIPSGRIT